MVSEIRIQVMKKNSQLLMYIKTPVIFYEYVVLPSVRLHAKYFEKKIELNEMQL